MKNKKFLALLLAVVLIFTQFSMVGLVSAETVALSGRETPFAFGVNAHGPSGYAAYTKPYDVILDAQALGANLVRTNSQGDSLDVGFAELAAERGMDVMFTVMLGSLKDAEGNRLAPSDVDYEAIYNRFYSKASALAKLENVAYIQIDNELDNQFLAITKNDFGYKQGTTAYEYANVNALAIAVYVANKAVTDAAPNIKTVINFSWKHYGILEALKGVEIDADTYDVATQNSTNVVNADWDVIGIDIYSDMGDDYKAIFSAVKEKYTKDIIVCETNLRPKETLGNNGSVEYYEDASWLEAFARYCYADERVIGFIPYELYDQPAFSANGYNTESYYGLIDENGQPKETYNIIRGLYSGTGVIADRTVVDTAINNVNTLKSTLLDNTVIGVMPIVYDWNVLEIEGVTAVDFSKGNFVEFDLYVEDAAALKRALLRDNLSLQVVLKDTENYQVVNSTITGETNLVNGWNHIVLSRGGFFDGNKMPATQYFKYDSVAKFALKVNKTGNNELSGMKMAIANICSTVDKIDTVPTYPDYAEVEISKDGKLTAWGDQYNWTIDQLYVNTPSVDISSVGQVEFDIYIEDYEAFKSAANTGTLVMVMSNNGENVSSNRQAFSFASQITKDGWNHITIDLTKTWSYGTDGNFDNTNLNRIAFVNWNGFGVINSIGGQMVRVANFCGTNAKIDRVPELPANTAAVLDKTGISKSIVQHAHYTISNILSTTVYNGYDNASGSRHFAATDFSTSSYVEFDIYYEKYDELVAKLNANSVKLRLYFSSANWWTKGASIDNLISYVGEVDANGWRHVKIPKSAFSGTMDWSSVVCWAIEQNGGTNFTVGEELCSVPFKMVNVCGTMSEIDIIPTTPEYVEVDIWKDGTKENWGAYNKIKGYKWFSTAIDVSSAENIEFDIYIEDYEAFLAADDNHWSFFKIANSSWDTPYAAYSFRNQIVKDGWNHVVIKDFQTKISQKAGTIDFTAIKQIGIVFWANTGDTNPISSTAMRIANICGTSAYIDRVPELPVNTTSVLDKEGISKKIVLNQYTTIDGILSTTVYNTYDSASGSRHFAATDFSTSSYVEFDIYYEKYDQLVAKLNENGVKLKLCLSTKNWWTPETSVNNLIAYVGEADELGWRHVKIPKSAFEGTIDWSSVICWEIAQNGGTKFTVGEELWSVPFKMVNICGTVELTVPTEVMKNKVDFIGATIQKVSFGNEGKADFETAKAINISKTKMLELDVFVGNDTITSFAVKLYDSNNGYALYNFSTTLVKGWNHLAVRISDGKDENGNPAQIDLSKIAGFVFISTANASVIVSNFYAADYVKGDGNRDGILDIRDLVAMKKYAVGITLASGMVGNKVAMDVMGNDYLVNSQDLSALRCYLLTDKWPAN